MSESRQLAAILFTDIVGYTALMGEDEYKAFELLKRNRLLQKPLIEKFNGTWIKEIGDGVLALFVSATDAVACACSILKACHHVPGLHLRMGIHLGDTVIQNGDVFGDGVNIASRLQALAPIDGIWISEAVHQNIANKHGLESHFVKKELLKNVRTPVRIYEVDSATFIPEQFESAEKSGRSKSRTIGTTGDSNRAAIAILKERKANTKGKLLRPKTFVFVAVLLIIISLFVDFYSKWEKASTARNSLLPEIQKLVSESYNQYPKAFALTLNAEKVIPDDPELKQIKAKITSHHSIQTNPEGANVFWRDQYNSSGEWIYIGKTPLINAETPAGLYRIMIEKPDFDTVFTETPWIGPDLNISLDSAGHLPTNMVRVYGSKARMLIVGLDQYGIEAGNGKFVQEFLMDKYEVTNSEFKKFLDAGGYRNRSYWEYTIIDHGIQIPWEKAMSLFHDETGRSGPSTWQLGTYPDGKENHPVTGISWYEAMAYAKFANKKLPTVYHWSQVANTVDTWTIIPRSNFFRIGTNPVGNLDNMSFWGVYDIAGNAREWCVNESQEKGQHFILGGGWNDPTYSYNDAYTQSSIDRTSSNGFRCMMTLPGDSCYAQLSSPMAMAHRDYSKEKSVNDGLFQVYLRQYDYDHIPLNAKRELILDSTNLRVEKIDMDAAYNHERLTLYLYTPKNISPPYQTILYFSGSNALTNRNFDFRSQLKNEPSFVLKGGRAFVYPILKSCWERGDGMYSYLPNETVAYKQHVICWVQDFRRSLDYLETQKDIDQSKFGFLGYSWGSSLGPIVCAIDSRFKAAVFHVGGLTEQKALPEVDPLNFVPRVRVPVLMLNGRNDTYYPIETAQKPMFNALGSGEKFKKMIQYDGGHLVPWSEFMKESTTWFDTYLGVAK